jgi:esterase/lipase superfamily enzyme
MNFFITNREIITDPNGREYVREDGRERASDGLRFGTYDLASRSFQLFPEPAHAAESVYEMSSSRPPEDLVGSARFFKLLYDQLIDTQHPEKNDVLFFIHGFNTDLDGVRGAFERLNKYYCDAPSSPIRHIIIFTWPGRSPAIPYHYFNDKQDAIHSGEALARGMEKVVRFMKEFLVNSRNSACHRNIHLMAHSMGHRVLKHMILEMRNQAIQTPELFKEILLMAADIEYSIFEQTEPFSDLIEMGSRVHVYYHEKDRVLDISKYTKNFSNRLGRYGRKRNDPNQVDVFDANVTVVTDDLEPGLSNDKLNHWYYYTSSDVVGDVIRVLTGSKSNYSSEASTATPTNG